MIREAGGHDVRGIAARVVACVQVLYRRLVLIRWFFGPPTGQITATQAFEELRRPVIPSVTSMD